MSANRNSRRLIGFKGSANLFGTRREIRALNSYGTLSNGKGQFNTVPVQTLRSRRSSTNVYITTSETYNDGAPNR